MNRTNDKTVWVLGAGFSQPLGGPLLTDLFRQRRYWDLVAEFPVSDYLGLASEMLWTQALYNAGNEREHYWENPEDFLHYVDEGSSAKRAVIQSACQRMELKYGGRIIERVSSGDEGSNETIERVIREPSKIARRVLAAECHRFLMERDADGEEWLPYLAWVYALNSTLDTVITFNYDRVLEMCGAGKFEVISPDQKSLPVNDKVPVFKPPLSRCRAEGLKARKAVKNWTDNAGEILIGSDGSRCSVGPFC